MTIQELLNQDVAPEMFRKVAFAMFGLREIPDKYQHLNPEDDIFDHSQDEETELLDSNVEVPKRVVDRENKRDFPN